MQTSNTFLRLMGAHSKHFTTVHFSLHIVSTIYCHVTVGHQIVFLLLFYLLSFLGFLHVQGIEEAGQWLCLWRAKDTEKLSERLRVRNASFQGSEN